MKIQKKLNINLAFLPVKNASAFSPLSFNYDVIRSREKHFAKTRKPLKVVFFLRSSQNYRFLDVDKFDYSTDGSRFVLARLRKHCQYEVVIQAINAFGEGPHTKPSLGRTMEDGE